MIAEIEIPGVQPKQRPRVAYSTRSVYTPQKTKDFENSVRLIYNTTCGWIFRDAVKVTMEFLIHRPKSAKREHPVVAPDTDNLVKAVLDGLNPVKDRYNWVTPGAWLDDAQVVEIYAVKRYTTGESRTIVRIEDYGSSS